MPSNPSEGSKRIPRSERVEQVAAGLTPVNAQMSIGRYTRQVWGRRRFVAALASSKLSAKHGKDRLGSLWLILTPLLNAATYYLIFGVLLDTQRGIENFVGFLIIGVFVYQFSASTINEGSRSIVSNTKLLQTLHFPRAVLPLSVVVRQVIAFMPALAVMFVIVLAIPPHASVTWRWLLVVPVLILQVAFSTGVALMLARLVARVNDISNLMQFVMRAWMYFSGIFYSFDRFDAYPTAKAVLELNPLHAFLTIYRDAVLYEQVAPAKDWYVAVAWSLAALVVGWVVFWRGEKEYGRV
ncbi:ABC-type polysaccharide/polyol phosphate export systems, permease component [Sanguibacter keddieii DSM 10542]|uniref:Transport permease protein n=2 Tax=Sanguibacter keddieii TaxID=60920 RepID=D1BC55_SANKS|nr:ABC-type polysaccharide/polyol phosphate export systems, permease component [Sanguibacter keddieii DSM 10542]